MRRPETGIREQKAIREAAKQSSDVLLERRCIERIKAYQSKYNEISDITGIDKEPKRMSIPRGTNTLKSVDFSSDGGIINYRLRDRAINIHNATDNGVFSFDDIEKDLSTSSIGKNVLKYIEDNNMFLNMNYDINVQEDIMGKIKGKDIKQVVEFVKTNYSDLPEGDLYVF